MSHYQTQHNLALTRLTQQLVRALVPGTEKDKQRSDQLVRQSVRELRHDTHGGPRREWEDVRSTLDGLSHTAKVRVQADLAEAIEQVVCRLEKSRSKGLKGWEGDLEVTMGNLPQHVHLLLNLARPASSKTHEHAYAYLHRTSPSGPTADQLLYEKIMAEEPYDPGEVYDEEIKHGWTDSDSDFDSDSESKTGSSLIEDSPAEDEVRTPSSAVIRAERKRLAQEARKEEAQDRLNDALGTLRRLQRGMYWRHGGRVGEEMREGIYGWKEMTTVTTSAAIARRLLDDVQVANRKVITARQFQREVLFALSGKPGILFAFEADGTCSLSRHHPQVQHLSPGALADILDSFRIIAFQAAQIRSFVNKTLQATAALVPTDAIRFHTTRSQTNKTQQAFAEACRSEMQKFDTWLAEQEASFTRHSDRTSSSAATTSLSLQREVRQRSSLLEHMASFIPHSHSSTLLLNLIYSTITSLRQTGTDDPHLPSLTEIFLQTVQPTWTLLGQWLQKGIPVPSALTAAETFVSSADELDAERAFDPEFFLQRDRDVSWADEDFWESGWVVGDDGWPVWLGEEVGELVLEAGKGRGLLRGLLGSVGAVEDWADLRDLLRRELGTEDIDYHLDESNGESRQISSTSTSKVDISESIAVYLKPTCQLIQFHLRRVLDDECGLEQHLEAIEGLMFMRSYKVMHDWQEWLFTKIRSNQRWTDFQLLTATMRDTMERARAGWMNPSAIRIRTVKPKDKEMLTSPRALTLIRADYQVPFPLSQLFTPTSIELRSEVFSFLLQIQMGRYLLYQTKLLDNELARAKDTVSEGTEQLSGLRHKLIWFLDTLWTWITERIIVPLTEGYRTRMGEMTSLKSMIALELSHARQIRTFCFLHPKDEEMLEITMRVLDMSQALNECFEVHAEELRASRPIPTNNITRRRTKAPRRSTKNGNEYEALSDADEEEDESEGRAKAIMSSMSFSDLSLKQRMTRISSDFDACMTELKEGVDRLSEGEGYRNDRGVTEEREGWEMLAFALEEWR